MGRWPSLVGHSADNREVAGSKPVRPTTISLNIISRMILRIQLAILSKEMDDFCLASKISRIAPVKNEFLVKPESMLLIILLSFWELTF